MLIPLILLAMVIPPPPTPADPSCDAECAAVLAAALEWTLAQVPSENRPQTFLDVGLARNPPTGHETPMIRARTRALIDIAARLGIPAKRREEDERFRICGESPDSAACRAAGSTTSITVRELDLLSQGEATILAEMRFLGGKEFVSPVLGTLWELRLRRIEGDGR